MERTLKDHIGQLEARIVILKQQLRNPELPTYSRSEYELDLGNAEQALKLFHRAYELEKRLSK